MELRRVESFCVIILVREGKRKVNPSGWMEQRNKAAEEEKGDSAIINFRIKAFVLKLYWELC